MVLLDHLPEYADKLDKKTVVDKIWPNLVRSYIWGRPESSNSMDSKLGSQILYQSSGRRPSGQSFSFQRRYVCTCVRYRSFLTLLPQFNERILNNDLLRFLAKMQSDPEASIRTNTCILLGRLGPTLGYNTKRKVLVPAFSRALKDPFVHCRVAGVMALMATIECFDVEELATKVIPNMSFGLVDKEKLVRDQAFKAMQLFVKKLEEHATTMVGS